MAQSKGKEIGLRIREERKKQGLTMQELGERMGISGSLVGRYERGEENPKQETVKRFADALGVLVPYLYPQGWKADEVQMFIAENPSSTEARAVEAADYILNYVSAKCINHESGKACFTAEEVSALVDSASSKAEKLFNIPEGILHEDDVENIASTYLPDASNNYQVIASGIFTALRSLNHLGQQIALERILELTEISRYQARSVATQTESTNSKTDEEHNGENNKP